MNPLPNPLHQRGVESACPSAQLGSLSSAELQSASVYTQVFNLVIACSIVQGQDQLSSEGSQKMLQVIVQHIHQRRQRQ